MRYKALIFVLYEIAYNFFNIMTLKNRKVGMLN